MQVNIFLKINTIRKKNNNRADPGNSYILLVLKIKVNY
jgi:hypothetical protein